MNLEKTFRFIFTIFVCFSFSTYAQAAKLLYLEQEVPQSQIQKFLNDENIFYEIWELQKRPLTDGEVLHAYQAEISRIQREKGYQQADLVSLSSDTPNLEKILKPFAEPH